MCCLPVINHHLGIGLKSIFVTALFSLQIHIILLRVLLLSLVQTSKEVLSMFYFEKPHSVATALAEITSIRFKITRMFFMSSLPSLNKSV